jgi:hypothetical protein
MVKTGVAIVVLGLVGLFGYFFLAASPERSSAEKAKEAALNVGDAVRDTGVAGLVDVRLKTKFGLDTTRFLHAHYNDGRVIVYGLVPAAIDQQALMDEAAQVPGVEEVELLVHPRPDYVVPLKGIGGSEPEPQAESPDP